MGKRITVGESNICNFSVLSASFNPPKKMFVKKANTFNYKNVVKEAKRDRNDQRDRESGTCDVYCLGRQRRRKGSRGEVGAKNEAAV